MIVPDSLKYLNLKDKDGNMVFRMVVYKGNLQPQLEDVIKACRR